MLDTDVIVAAVRSPSGASAALLDLALQSSFKLLLSVPLAMEYESLMKSPRQMAAGRYSVEHAETLILALCKVCERVERHFLWRPILKDPGDEMVLETAVNGQADFLVTFNLRDYSDVPERFGVALLRPSDLLVRFLK